MQEKHPLETILEELILKLPNRGAIRATTKPWAVAELDKWRTARDAEPAQAPDSELEALRTMREAVRKALTWGPPSIASQVAADIARAIPAPLGQPRLVAAPQRVIRPPATP